MFVYYNGGDFKDLSTCHISLEAMRTKILKWPETQEIDESKKRIWFVDSEGAPTKQKIREFCKMNSRKILIYIGHGLYGEPMIGKYKILETGDLYCNNKKYPLSVYFLCCNLHGYLYRKGATLTCGCYRRGIDINFFKDKFYDTAFNTMNDTLKFIERGTMVF